MMDGNVPGPMLARRGLLSGDHPSPLLARRARSLAAKLERVRRRALSSAGAAWEVGNPGQICREMQMSHCSLSLPLQLASSPIAPKRKGWLLRSKAECLKLLFPAVQEVGRGDDRKSPVGRPFPAWGHRNVAEGAPVSALQGSGWGRGWLLSNCSGDTPEAEMNICLFLTIGLGAIQ